MRSPALVSLLSLTLAFAACGSPPAPPRARTAVAAPQPTADERFEAAYATFFADYATRHPTIASGLGMHELDGKLPAASAAAISELQVWLDQSIATFAGFEPAQLSEARRVERDAILASLKGERFSLTRWTRASRDPMFYVGELALDAYISREYAPLDVRARGVIGIAEGAADRLLAAQANLPGAMPRTWVETAILMVSGHIAFAKKDVAAAFAGLTDAELEKRMTAALAAYVDALTNYKQFLERAKKNSTDDFALGPEMFLEMLADGEGFTIDLARLEAIGKADLDRNLAALADAATAMKKSPAQAVKLVAADRPTAAQLIAVAADQAVQARQYLLDKQLVTIPSDDIAKVEETPAFARWNSAFMSAPGVFEPSSLPTYYWITLPDPSWSKKDQTEYIPGRADLLFTTVHELWPGHFLHFLHMKQTKSKALRAFCSYAMTEGWAHYVEEMMVEEGFGAGDPKTRVGMLLNALLRDVRFVSAIGLHTQGMKVAESAKLFQTKAFSDKKTAMQQAVRGTFDPGYLNYTLGKLAIRKLRDDWKAKLGDRYSVKDFHDRVLSYGCAPLPAIRRAMLGDDSPAL